MCCAFCYRVTLALTQETTLNGNAAYTAAPVEAQEQVYQPLPVQEPSEQPISSPGVGAEEAHEDLDTEVSQINTQSKTQSSEPAESYSRPMSRTSSMTPVNSWHSPLPLHLLFHLMNQHLFRHHFAGNACQAVWDCSSNRALWGNQHGTAFADERPINNDP